MKHGTRPDLSRARLEADAQDAKEVLALAKLKEPNGSLAKFAGYVEAGEPPRAAARRLIDSLERA